MQACASNGSIAVGFSQKKLKNLAKANLFPILYRQYFYL
jgi:hypothetical protein